MGESCPTCRESHAACALATNTADIRSCIRSDFLETLDDQEFFTGTAVNGTDIYGSTALDVSDVILPPNPASSDSTTPESPILSGHQTQAQVNDVLQRYVDLVPPVLPTADLTEKFLLTAADPAPGSRDERLKRVIRTKYEAGLLKPYNFVKGYSRLLRWLDCKYAIILFLLGPLFMFGACSVSQESKQQILQPLSVLRPKFRVSFCIEGAHDCVDHHLQAVAQSLRDIVHDFFFDVVRIRLHLSFRTWYSSRKPSSV